MSPAKPEEREFSHLQDVLGSLPMLKRYIPIVLVFPLEGQNEEEEEEKIIDVVNELRRALHRLGQGFPHLAGQVVIEGRSEKSTGVTKIKYLDGEIGLVVRDYRNEGNMPGLAELRDTGFPFTMLDPSLLAPAVVSMWTTDETDMIAPVFVVQANFVRRGLLLTVSGNHMAMDMTGLGLVVGLFSKACRNEFFMAEELAQGNQPRDKAIPLYGPEWEPDLTEIDDNIAKPARSNPVLDDPASLPQWAYFLFAADRVAQLKVEASSTNDVTPYISTDDALSALCWQRTNRARVLAASLASIPVPATTTFCRVITTRKHLDLQGYQGHMTDCVYEEYHRHRHRHRHHKDDNNSNDNNNNNDINEKSDATNLWNQPTGHIAGRLRLLLSPSPSSSSSLSSSSSSSPNQPQNQQDRIKHHIRATATLLNRLSDKSKIVYGANLNPTTDLVLSSYTNTKLCDLDFGPFLGHRPLVARRPRTSAWPGLVYIMPRDRNGDLAVAMCLAERDLDRLRDDQGGFLRYCQYIG